MFLASLGYAVTAVDLSTEGLRKAERLAQERGVTLDLVQADLADYELEANAFSGIVSIFAHLPAPVRRRLYARIPQALVRGGVLVLESYRPRSCPRSPSSRRSSTASTSSSRATTSETSTRARSTTGGARPCRSSG